MGFNKNPEKEFNKIYNGVVPTSMSDGGGDLDAGCRDIETAEAGRGLDSVTKQLARDTTEFTRQTTSHEGSPANGQPGLPMMSETGKRLASKTAPQSVYETTTIGQSAVDKIVRR